MSHKLLPALLAAALLAGPALAQDKQKVKVKRKNKTEAPATAPAPTTDAPASAGPGRQAPVPPDYAAEFGATITQDDLRKHLTVLASDEYEGRETGEKGQKMAADYIATRFKELGLVGPVQNSDNPYLQHFTMERSTWAGTGTLKVGGQSFQWMKDFYGAGNSPFDQATTLQPVFVGYGIEDAGWNDYAGLDVKGKDVVVLLGEPTNTTGQRLLEPSKSTKDTKWGLDYRAKSALATQKGARSVLFVAASKDDFDKAMGRVSPYLSRPSISFMDKKESRAATFFVSPAVGYKLLGTNEAALGKYRLNAAAAGKPPVSAFKPAAVSLTAPKKREQFTTENVLGFLEGSDKKDEIIVVSAHYDHIGIISGEVHNGADDDGSGTVSVLELAQAFTEAKKAGHGPRRSMLFLTVTGEEKGLLGSEYYTDHPVFPLAQTVADLNIDMVGRTDKEHEGKPDYVYVIGSDKLSSQLHTIVLNANQQYTNIDLDFRFNDPADPNRFYYRSDHYNFAKHKIPVAFFFNGVHADYHGPKDEVDKIEFPKMEKRARLVYYAAWELANREERIPVDSNKP